MKFISRAKEFKPLISRRVGILVIFLLTFWSLGYFAPITEAANVTVFKDTLSTSVASTLAIHDITYTQTTTVTAGGTTVTVTFPSGFAMGSTNAVTDVTLKIATVSQTLVASGATGTQWNSSISGQVLTLSTGPSATITAGQAVEIIVGATNKITNHATPASYSIVLGGTQADSGTTQIAITNSIAVTAAVNTTLTFTIAGVSSGTGVINGEASDTNQPISTTSVTTTATTIPWGTLTAGTAKVAQLTTAVTTNAQNGFSVTLQENQVLTSGTGATIGLFSQGAATSTPTIWVAPTNLLATPATRGHYGVTTNSTEGTSEFITGGSCATQACYAGNLATARQLSAKTGPCDGTTTPDCLTTNQFKISIGSLQAAGSDYANTFVYICTPSF